jgi:hypothetical protein
MRFCISEKARLMCRQSLEGGKTMKQAKKIAAACLGLATLLAQPALAAGTNGNSAGTAQNAAARAGGKGDANAKQHCRNVTLDSGTRVSRKVCRTRAAWAEEGVELKK